MWPLKRPVARDAVQLASGFPVEAQDAALPAPVEPCARAALKTQAHSRLRIKGTDFLHFFQRVWPLFHFSSSATEKYKM